MELTKLRSHFFEGNFTPYFISLLIPTLNMFSVIFFFFFYNLFLSILDSNFTYTSNVPIIYTLHVTMIIFVLFCRTFLYHLSKFIC